MDNLRNTYLDKIETLRKAALAYYFSGEESPLSDEEYDLILETVISMGEAYDWDEHVKLAEEVAGGSKLDASSDKVAHRTRMLSLAKAQDAETLEKFLEKMRVKQASILLEPKLDGLAIVAIYRDGELVQVATRGDSHEGQNVTARALSANIVGMPHSISYEGELEIRGELFMTTEQYAEAQRLLHARTAIQKNCKVKGEGHVAVNCPQHGRQYKHSRNAVSGMIQSKDVERIAGVTLTFGTYDVIPVAGSALEEDSYSELLTLATRLGFVTTSSMLNGLFPADADVHEKVVAFGKMKKEVNFPTDGIVVKIDSLSMREDLGNGERHPRWAVAYKYEAEIKEAILEDIVRDVGRTGAISYVAKFCTPEFHAEKGLPQEEKTITEPGVILDGTAVAKSTVNNARFIADLDLHIGDTVLVRKANEIIPEIVSVVFTGRKDKNLSPYVAPTTCPKCDEELDTTSSIIWRCGNAECAVANRIIHAVGRDNLDIDGISGKLIESLLEGNLINDVTDLYSLTVKQIAELPTGRFYSVTSAENKEGESILVGELMAKKHFKNIQDSKDRELHRILSSLGVRFLGRTFSRSYASHFKSFDNFVNATVEELQGIDKVKDKALGIRKGLDAIAPLLEKYRKVGFLNMNHVEEKILGSALKGEIVVITGSIPGYGRNEAKDLIAAHGGVAGGSVSGKTTLVVAPEDERDTTKAKKADSLGITIITPEKLLVRLGLMSE